MEIATLKVNREEVEKKKVLSDNFNHLKKELQAMRGELANNMAAIKTKNGLDERQHKRGGGGLIHMVR